MFITLLSFARSLAIKAVSLNNQSYQAILTLIGVNLNESLYYPFTLSVIECGKVKYMKIKVCNLMSRVNESRFSVQHDSCERTFKLN